MTQTTIGTVDLLARRVRYLLDARNILDVELARHLGITGSGLSKSFKRPGALAAHLPKVADFFGVKEKDLLDTKLSDDDVLKTVKSRAGAAVPTDIRITGANLVRLAKDEIGHFGKGRWALLAEKVRAPERGELVAWTDGEGYLIRRYVPQADGSIFLVHPHDAMAIKSVSSKEAGTLRVVIAVCDYVGDRKDNPA